VLTGALELDYRAHGERPRVPDSVALLGLVVRAAESAPGDAIIIAGSSRALADIDAATLSAALGGRPVFQLARDGISCLPTLDQLARETTFAGTVLCGTEPTSLFGIDERDRERTGLPVLRLPSLTWAGWIDARSAVLAQSHLAILSRDIRAMERPIFGRGAWPAQPPPADPMQRASMRHFTGIDTAAADARWAALFETGGGRSTSPEELAATIAYVRGLVARLARRGGRVVFVELPSNGRTHAVEERRYPRATYWNPFAAQVGAPTLTVRDLPALNAFHCPDGSHLDADDAPAFTGALAAALPLLASH
jgi:hypothetical protein